MGIKMVVQNQGQDQVVMARRSKLKPVQIKNKKSHKELLAWALLIMAKDYYSGVNT